MNEDTNPIEDSLYVNWHLLDGLNHDCEYSREPPEAATENYVREPLLLAAYRLLSLNRPEYVFHFYGGEPTIHPYFPDLLTYIGTSGRNVRVILETNGLRRLIFYEKLLHPMAHGSVCVRLDVHPKYMEARPLLTFVSTVIEAGQFCTVSINHIPTLANKAMDLYHKCMLLRRRFSFGLCMVYPMGGSAHVIVPEQPAFPLWTKMPDIADETASEPLVFDENETFAVVGANAVQVGMDGTCTLGLKQDDLPFAPQVIENANLRDDMPKMPFFFSRDEAEQWLNLFQRRSMSCTLEGGPMRVPYVRSLNAGQRLHRQLKNLHFAASAAHKEMPICATFWTGRQKDILRLKERLADDDSRDVLLRRIKAQLLGDSAYMAESEYALWGHPALVSLELTSGEAEFGRLRLVPATREVISRLKAKITWYRPILELAFDSSGDWLDILCDLTSLLPDHKFHLGQHGLQTVCYAVPSSPCFSYRPLPSRSADGHPLVSMIVCADNDEDHLRATVHSALALRFPRYEVVIMQDTRVVTCCTDALTREHPWHVRAFRFDEPMSLTALWNAGLRCIQGEYVCFLRSGDKLHANVLEQAVEALEAMVSDMVICAEDIAPTRIIGSLAACELEGKANIASVAGKLYRTTVLQKHAIRFSELPQDMEDSLFNFQALHAMERVHLVQGVLVDTVCVEGQETPLHKRVDVFFDVLKRLWHWALAHDEPYDSDDVRAYATQCFIEVREDFLNVVRAACADGSINDVLSEDRLQCLRHMPHLLEVLWQRITTQLAARAEGQGVTFVEQPEDVGCDVYEGAATYYKTHPTLACVITGMPGDSLACLEMFATADACSVECLLVDNGLDAAARERAEIAADMYPHVRLLHMRGKASFHEMTRTALSTTHASHMIFMRGSDEPDAEFLNTAVALVQNRQDARESMPDVLVFGLRDIYGMPLREVPGDLEGALTDRESLFTWLEQKWPFSLAGLLIRTELLRSITVSWSLITDDNLAESVLLQAKCVLYAKQCLTVQEKRKEQVDSRAVIAKGDEAIEVVARLLPVFAARKRIDTPLQAAIREYMWKKLLACNPQQWQHGNAEERVRWYTSLLQQSSGIASLCLVA